jgi:protein O-GlcNAc transferase
MSGQPQEPQRVVTADDLLAQALRLHQAGKVDIAAELYQRVLDIAPDQPYAQHLLGEIMLRRKDYPRAHALIGAAVAQLPTHPEAHNNLAAVLQSLNRPDEAELMYRRAVALKPDFALAHSNLGALLLAQGRAEDAEAALQRAIGVDPRLADAHLNLGNLRRAAKDLPAAETCYRRAIDVAPRHASAYVNLGLVLAARGQWEAALDSYLRASLLNPHLPEIQINLGKLHAERHDHRAAEACYRRAVELAPDSANAHNNLGVALFAQRRFADAALSLRRAVELRPNFTSALNNLGAALRNIEQLHEAVLCFERVLALKPHHAGAHNNRGLTLVEMGRVAEGLEAMQAAMRYKPNFARAHSNYLLCLNYLDTLTPADLRAAHEAFDTAFRRGQGPAEPVPVRDRSPDRRLRIGYVSPDFKRHSCAFFIEKLLAHHDKAAVEVFCYADVLHPDPVTERLKGHADHWRDTARLRRDEFRAQVTADGIDILVDLAGHTADNRMDVLADRLAPVQVNWLGYPATTGLASMDYRLTDARADPVGESDAHAVERLLRLPDTFLCYQPPAEAPEVSAAPNASGAPFTFASFNNTPKMTRDVVAAWARILRAVPQARLLLKSRSLIDAATRARISAEFAAEGVPAARLELVGWLRKPDDHLRLYETVDLALDPFPYNGTTTTCEALWMGVPVLTLAGRRHAARVGASLLGGLGLADYVAADVDDYVARAVSLANAPAPLNTLRRELRARMAASPLCDGTRFARAMEAAYQTMWQTWRAKNG